ncbi:MAG: hypothetical protein ACI85O_002997 [Saprospiraceae bacterium]|jgi:hypothetical protein
MHTKYFFLFLSIFVFSNINAQIDSAFLAKKAQGVVGITDAQLIDYLMITMPNGKKESSATLKKQSIKTYMMPPRKADESGNTKCYALTACAEYYINYQENYKVNLSPDYVSLSMPEDNLEEALSFLVKNGTVSADIMPYGSKFIPPSVRATQKYAMQNFLYIFRHETKARQKIFALRKAIVRGNPVLVEMRVPSDFAAFKNEELLLAEKSMTAETAPFVVVGYDENTKTVELLGTYGSAWGDNGYLEVSYDDFGEMAVEGFVLVPERN